MTEGLISGTASNRWAMVPVGDIIVYERQREVDDKHVAAVAESFKQLGSQMQLTPIVLSDKGDHLKLIDGAHRLEAAKRSGWTHIRAEIWTGLLDEDEPLLEAESNRIRKPLSAVEIEEVWSKVLEPAFRARSKQNQIDGGRAGGLARKVTGNPGNLPSGEASVRQHINLDEAARSITGLSRDTLAKVADVRSFAESTTSPPEVVQAAKRGLEKIKQGAGVNAVHKAVMNLEFKSTASASETEARRREKRLDQTVSETTLLAEHLGKDLGADLRIAAKTDQMSREQLRAIRVALAHALSEIVVIECELAEDSSEALRTIGSEVTRLMSDRSIKALDLEVDDGNH